MTETVEQQQQSDDERRLAELGYTQELQRAWSGFSNFAISFTIISVLAGCFTTYGQAWNNGGPIAISWGWPIICGLILLVAFSMAELVSAYPTAGGIYYWASTLGGPKWGWFTGWFNLVGLVGVVASVDYGCAQFMNATLSLFGVNLGFANWGDTAHVLTETFLLFMVILTLHALINIYSSPLVALFNNISVFWHVAGVAAIVLVLAFVPGHAPERRLRVHRDDQQLGLRRRDVLVLRAAARLPADDVHADRLRRVARTSPRRRTARPRPPRRASGARSSGRASAAGSCCWRSRSRRPTWPGSTRLAGSLAGRVLDRAAGGLAEDRRGDRDDRPAVLRHGLRDVLLAHDLRVLARSRGARLAAVDAAEPPPRARLRRDLLLRRRADHDAAGARGRRQRRAVRVLRGRLDLRDRALHRLRDAGLPALADGRRVRARGRGRSATSTAGSTRPRSSGSRSA